MRRSPNIIYVGDRLEGFTVLSAAGDYIVTLAPEGVEHLDPYPGCDYVEEWVSKPLLTPAVDGPQSRSRDGGSGEGEGVNVPDPPPPAPDDLGHRT